MDNPTSGREPPHISLAEFDRDPHAIIERSRRERVVVCNEEGSPWITLNPPWQPLAGADDGVDEPR